MIKAIVFDLGGVIISPIKHYADGGLKGVFGEHAETVEKLYEEKRNDLVTGKLNTLQFLAKVKNLTGIKDPSEVLYSKWKDFYAKEVEGINEELLSKIESLRKTCDVYMLTDTIDIHDDHNKNRGIYDKFNKVFKSYEDNTIKSDPNTFVKLLNKININPQEVVFVDDKQEYVQIANNLGIHGIVFENNEKLKEDLSQFGISL